MIKKILFFSFPFFSLLFPTTIEIKKDNTFENKSNLITKEKKFLKNYGNVTKKAIENFLNKEKITKNWIFEQYFEVFKNPNIISFNVKNQNIVNVENDEKYVVSLNLKDDGAVYLDKQIYNKMSYIASEISTFSPTGNFLSYNFYNGIFNSSNNEYTFNGTGEKENKDIVAFKGVISNNNLIKSYHESIIGNFNGGSNKNKIFKIIDIVLYILGGVIMAAAGLYSAAGAFFAGAGAAGAGLAGAEAGAAAGAGAAEGAAGAAGAAEGIAGAAGAEGLGAGLAGAGAEGLGIGAEGSEAAGAAGAGFSAGAAGAEGLRATAEGGGAGSTAGAEEATSNATTNHQVPNNLNNIGKTVEDYFLSNWIGRSWTRNAWSRGSWSSDSSVEFFTEGSPSSNSFSYSFSYSYSYSSSYSSSNSSIDFFTRETERGRFGKINDLNETNEIGAQASNFNHQEPESINGGNAGTAGTEETTSNEITNGIDQEMGASSGLERQLENELNNVHDQTQNINNNVNDLINETNENEISNANSQFFGNQDSEVVVNNETINHQEPNNLNNIGMTVEDYFLSNWIGRSWARNAWSRGSWSSDSSVEFFIRETERGRFGRINDFFEKNLRRFSDFFKNKSRTNDLNETNEIGAQASNFNHQEPTIEESNFFSNNSTANDLNETNEIGAQASNFNHQKPTIEEKIDDAVWRIINSTKNGRELTRGEEVELKQELTSLIRNERGLKYWNDNYKNDFGPITEMNENNVLATEQGNLMNRSWSLNDLDNFNYVENNFHNNSFSLNNINYNENFLSENFYQYHWGSDLDYSFQEFNNLL